MLRNSARQEELGIKMEAKVTNKYCPWFCASLLHHGQIVILQLKNQHLASSLLSLFLCLSSKASFAGIYPAGLPCRNTLKIRMCAPMRVHMKCIWMSSHYNMNSCHFGWDAETQPSQFKGPETIAINLHHWGIRGNVNLLSAYFTPDMKI